jgi:hypothetical protein
MANDKPVQCKWAECGIECKNPIVMEQHGDRYVKRCPFVGYYFQDRIGCFCQHFIHNKPVRYDIMAGDIVIKSYSTSDDFYAKQNADEYLEELQNIHIEVCDDSNNLNLKIGSEIKMLEEKVLIVAGPRDFNKASLFLQEFIKYYKQIHPDLVISGACRGVDTMCRTYCEGAKIPFKEFIIDWKTLAELGTHLLAFYNGSKGINNMIKAANEKGLTVKIVNI